MSIKFEFVCSLLPSSPITIFQLQADILSIEADTYAQFVGAGRLNEVPESILQEVFKEDNQLRQAAREAKLSRKES